MSAPCPVCGLRDGFHDHGEAGSLHDAHVVPRHLVQPIIVEVGHRWTGPRPPIDWPHCRVCGVVKRRDNNDSKVCAGPVTIGLRDGSS